MEVVVGAWHLNILYSILDRGDRICKYFAEINNTCTVYNDRPIICNINKMYEYYFSKKYTREEYYKTNKKSCNVLRANNGKISNSIDKYLRE